MPSSQCVFNPATALRRVFMPSTFGGSHSLHLTRIFVPALLALPPQTRAYWAGRDGGASQPPPRSSSAIFDRDSYSRPPARTQPGNGFGARRAARSTQKKPDDPDAPGPRVGVKLGRMPRDNEINWPYVYVTPGSEGPRPIKEVLAELDPKTTYLEAVALPNAEEKGSPRWPVCRIVNKKEELAKQKAMKHKKKGVTKEKELELNWTLAPHDLEHKLKSLQRFLNKGYKVQVLLQRKVRGKATASEEGAKALLESINEAVQEVKGAREWKGREGKVLGSYRIFLQGKIPDETGTPSRAAAVDQTPTVSSDAVEGTSTAESNAAEESPVASGDAALETERSSRSAYNHA